MKLVLNAVILGMGLAAAQAFAGCDYPTAPGKFPDGNQASKDEMIAAKKVVVQYNNDMTAYLDCIQKEFDEKVAGLANATPEQKAEMQKMQDQKHDAAVDELQAVAARFNEQLRTWKAKNGGDKKPS